MTTTNQTTAVDEVEALLTDIRSAFADGAAPALKFHAAEACLLLHARLQAQEPDVLDLLLERLLPLAPPAGTPIAFAPRLIPGKK